ncbi:hypothetical protein TNCV_2516081 [Trichonephila clavipes]|nr:hypothetical protein TNCV_2516081 [Trichonephila clavipes]
MGTAIPNVLQTGAIVWFENTQGPLEKVQSVPGWRPMKQLAVCVHFLRRFSRRLVCRGFPEPGLRVNDISGPLVPTPPQNTIRAA